MALLPLPPKLAKRYPFFRLALYIAVFAVVLFLAERSLFPVISYSFDFRNPDAHKNDLLDPRNQKGKLLENGRLAKGDTLFMNVGTSGVYDKVFFSLLPETEADAQEKAEIKIRHGYRAAWLPEGQAVTDFPAEELYVSTEDSLTTYYALREGTLYRFVSEDAFLSRFPKEKAKPIERNALAALPLSEKILGFRHGTLVAFADGIFLITDDEFMRPIGSARIFLSLGYRFEDVKQVNAEELGIYKRGKIFLSGDIHPSGTVFQNTDTGTYFLLDGGERHDLPPSAYRDLLLSQTAPILYSSIDSKKTASCIAEKKFPGRSLECTINLESLMNVTGNDYELAISNTENETDIRTATLAFATEKSRGNLLFILSQQKDLFLSRLGIIPK